MAWRKFTDSVGGGGFALGQADNIFGTDSGSGTVSTVTIAPDLATAEATRETYDGNNVGWKASYLDLDNNIILYFEVGADKFIQYQRNIGGTWTNNGSPVDAIKGDTGAVGATGNSFFFSSIGTIGSGIESERDGFFSIPGKSALLNVGQPIEVNIGNDTISTFNWSGADQPATYTADDIGLWVLSSKEINSGSLFLGQDGAKVSSASQVLGFTGADGVKRLITGAEYNDDGSHIPEFWILNRQSTVPITTVFDTQIATTPGATVAATNDETLRNFTIRPATVGTVRIQTWLNNAPSGPQIVDIRQDVVGGDIGNELIIEVPNDILVLNGQNTFTTITGIEFFGGLQTQGPLIGQVAAFVEVDVQLARKERNETKIDDFVHLNRTLNTVGYKTGGLIVANEGLAEVDTIVSQVFTPGVAAVSNPAVTTVGGGTFSANQIIAYIPDDDTPDANEGLFEVVSHTGNTLVVAGVGTTPLTDQAGFSDQFSAQRGTGSFRRVAVAGIRTALTGKIEHVFGSTTPLTIDRVATIANDQIVVRPASEFGTAAFAITTFAGAPIWVTSVKDEGGAPTVAVETIPFGKRLDFGASVPEVFTNKEGDDYDLGFADAGSGYLSVSKEDTPSDVGVRVYGFGNETDVNRELLEMSWSESAGEYKISTFSAGAGVDRGLLLDVNNLRLEGTGISQEFKDPTLLNNDTTSWGAPARLVVQDKMMFSFGAGNVVHSHDITNVDSINALKNFTSPTNLAIQSYSAVSGNPALTRVNSVGSWIPIGFFPNITNGVYAGLREVVSTDTANGAYFDIDVPFSTSPAGTDVTVETYGDYASVRLVGGYVYATDNDNSLFIYRVDGDFLAPIGGIPNSDKVTVARDIVVNGNYAYWICADGGAVCGFVVVDISDKTRPVIVKEVDLTNRYFKGEVVGNILYVAGAGASLALATYDVSDPANPVFLDSIAGHGANQDGIELRGNVAYLVGFTDSELTSFDVSDPANIVELDTTTVITGPTGIAIFGSTIVVSNGTSIEYLDVSNPSVMTTILTDVPPNGGIGKPEVYGNRMYVPTSSVNGMLFYNLKGIDTDAITAGSIEVEELTVNKKLSVNNSLDVLGALSLKGPFNMAGPASIAGRSIFGTPNNVVHVCKLEDFPTPIANVITLAPNTTYNLYNDDPASGPNTISIGDNVIMGPSGLNSCSITSESLGSTILNSDTTGAMFNTDATFSGFFHISNVFCSVPNGNAFAITGFLPPGFEFFPRLFVSDAGFFNFQGLGTISVISFNMATGAFFAGVGGPGRGLSFIGTREALVDDVRFTDWQNTAGTTVINFFGNNDTNRVTGCTFGFGDEVSVFNIDASVPSNNTILLNSNSLEGGKGPFLQGESGVITTFTDVTISGTTTNVADGGGVAEFTFAGAGPILVGASMTLGGHTNDSYNGFFRVLTAGLVVTLADAITGVTVGYVGNDSGTWISEATLVQTPSTTGLATGTSVNINGTIDYNNDDVKVVVEDVDGVIVGNVFTSASVPDWTALGLTVNDALVLTKGAAKAIKIRAIAVGSLTLEQSPGDAVGQTFLATQFRPAFIWDIFSNISFKIARRFTTAETPTLGSWNSGSATQTDKRVNASGNVGLPNTKVIASMTAQNVGMDETTIIDVDTFASINLEAGAVAQARELEGISRFVVSNASSGELTYTGKEDFEGTLFAVLTVKAASSAPGFTFRVLKNGAIDVGLIRSEVDAATGATTTLPLTAPVTAVTGDTFQLQAENVDNTINVIVTRCTIEIQ